MVEQRVTFDQINNVEWKWSVFPILQSRMESDEENEEERYDWKGKEGIGNHLGAFLEYFKIFEVFFLKNTCQVILKKSLLSVFPDFQKCF